MTRTDDTFVPDYPGLLRLDGRRFVVLGAGQGIGRQASHALASVGARSPCVDVEPDLAADIAGEVDGIPISGNAYDRDDVERMFTDAARDLGGIDGVVDIIGMARYADLTEMSDEDWDWHFDIVLRHAFLAMQYGGRAMQESGGGTMVFVASVSGITSAPRHSAYGAAKAGLMSLVRSGAVELGPHGIRVNAVAPGVVWTPRVSAFLGEEGLERNIANTPLRRVAQPADIAAAIAVPGLGSRGVRHGPDALGGRRRRREVPIPHGRSVTAAARRRRTSRVRVGRDGRPPVPACRSGRPGPASRATPSPPARLPVGVRLELVGDPEVVELDYLTRTEDLGVPGGPERGTSFAVGESRRHRSSSERRVSDREPCGSTSASSACAMPRTRCSSTCPRGCSRS